MNIIYEFYHIKAAYKNAFPQVKKNPMEICNIKGEVLDKQLI